MILVTVAILLLPAMIFVDLLLGRGRGPGSRLLDAVAIGPALGLGLATLLDFAVRDRLDRNLRMADLVLAWGVLILPVLLFRGPKAASRREISTVEACGMKPARLALFLLTATLCLGVSWFACVSSPRGGWDGIAVWNMMGRTLAICDGNASARMAPIEISHPEYPLFLPGSVALLLRSDIDSSAWPGVLMGMLGMLGLVGLTHRGLVRLRGEAVALTVVILLMVTPCFLIRATDQYADTWVAALNIGAALFIAVGWSARRESWRELVIGGLLLGLLPWIKQEGTYLSFALLLSLALASLGRGRLGRGLRDLLVVLMAASPGLLGSLAYRLSWAATDDRLKGEVGSAGSMLIDPERWAPVLAALGAEITTGGRFLIWGNGAGDSLAFERWAFFWPALVLFAALWWSRRGLRRRDSLFLLLVGGAQLMATLMIYVILPRRQGWHIDVAFSRTLMQVAPILLLVVAAGSAPASSGEPEVEGEAGIDDAEAAALVEGQSGGVA